jgi:hypothetical protein
MRFRVYITDEAEREIAELSQSDPVRADKVRRTIGKMQIDIRSKGLSTHEYTSKSGPNGEKLFEAYIENNTPNAHRIIWCYGPEQGAITVINVIPYPKDAAKK